MVCRRTFRLASRYCSTIASKELCVLGIETSCDDTALAVVSSTRGVLADVRHGQWALTRRWGGVKPDAAADEHTRVIGSIAQQTLKNANVSMQDIAAIAVTAGPGMPYCLESGLQFAKQLARENPHAKLLPINHLEAHAICALRDNPSLQFPFLTLLISGGHTILWVAEGIGKHRMLGQTLDDAFGEALDKAGKMIGIKAEHEEPMGAALVRLALTVDYSGRSFRFAAPMAHKDHWLCDFSFSGLKTSLQRRLTIMKLDDEAQELSSLQKAEISRSFLEACISHLETRMENAFIWAHKYRPSIKNVVICGGCAASTYICERLKKLADTYRCSVAIPPRQLCSDNGVMIADLGLRRLQIPGVEGASLAIAYHTQWPVGPRVPNFDDQMKISKAERRVRITKSWQLRFPKR